LSLLSGIHCAAASFAPKLRLGFCRCFGVAGGAFAPGFFLAAAVI
jgi:hypothetical protein